MAIIQSQGRIEGGDGSGCRPILLNKRKMISRDRCTIWIIRDYELRGKIITTDWSELVNRRNLRRYHKPRIELPVEDEQTVSFVRFLFGDGDEELSSNETNKLCDLTRARDDELNFLSVADQGAVIYCYWLVYDPFDRGRFTI